MKRGLKEDPLDVFTNKEFQKTLNPVNILEYKEKKKYFQNREDWGCIPHTHTNVFEIWNYPLFLRYGLSPNIFQIRKGRSQFIIMSSE